MQTKKQLNYIIIFLIKIQSFQSLIYGKIDFMEIIDKIHKGKRAITQMFILEIIGKSLNK